MQIQAFLARLPQVRPKKVSAEKMKPRLATFPHEGDCAPSAQACGNKATRKQRGTEPEAMWKALLTLGSLLAFGRAEEDGSCMLQAQQAQHMESLKERQEAKREMALEKARFKHALHTKSWNQQFCNSDAQQVPLLPFFLGGV